MTDLDSALDEAIKLREEAQRLTRQTRDGEQQRRNRENEREQDIRMNAMGEAERSELP